MVAQSDRILIIGAGIGGLTAALALQQRGFKPMVYERSSMAREVGAGVILWQNARRALRDLGIDEALAKTSLEISTAYFCDYATGKVLEVRSAERLVQQHGMGDLRVHRADLHDLLLQAVTRNDADAVHPGHEFARLTQSGDAIEVEFTNGALARCDVMIGADGNSSAVRSQIFPGEKPVFTGQVAFRALIPWNLLPPAIAQRPNALYPGPQRMLVHHPVRRQQMMYVSGIGRSATWEEEGWSIPAAVEEFATAYSDFAPEIVAMIRSIPPGSLFKMGLRDREPLATWTKGRVTMLGGRGASDDPISWARCVHRDRRWIGTCAGFRARRVNRAGVATLRGRSQASRHQRAALVARAGPESPGLATWAVPD